MTYSKKQQMQMTARMALFDNLADGALSETDEGTREWAAQHGLEIAAVAEDNRDHLRRALAAARNKSRASDQKAHLKTGHKVRIG